jgi:hypothetical protein
VSAVNSPVDGSNIPEEESSPPEDDPEGGAVLAAGAKLSEVELLGRSSSIRGIHICRKSIHRTGVRGGIPGTGVCSDIRGARDRRVI